MLWTKEIAGRKKEQRQKEINKQSQKDSNQFILTEKWRSSVRDLNQDFGELFEYSCQIKVFGLV